MNQNSDFLNLIIERDNLLHQLNESRKVGEYTDVKLQVGDKVLPAHRGVLSHSSPVLKALISDQWSTTNVYLLCDQYVDPEIMEDILSFFYTGKIKLTPDNVHPVCMAAHFLQIPNLLGPSVKHLCQFITIENVLTLFKFATACEIEELNYSCLRFVNNNHETVFQNPLVLKFSFKEFEDLIVGLKKFWAKMLRENTFHCIVRWTEKGLSGRSDDLPILMKNIPMEELPLKFLTETVSTHPLVKNSISSIEAVSAALANYQTHSNLELQTNQNLIVFGGTEKTGYDYKPVKTMNCYDSHTRIWKKLPDLLSYRSDFAATITNQQDIIICGGTTWQYPSIRDPSIDMFDWNKQIWSKLTELPCWNTSHMSIAICKGDLYVLGAEEREYKYFSAKVLCYSFETKQWKYVQPMKEERDNAKLIAHKDYLYVFGGFASTVERYDPTRDEWTWMSNMKSRIVYAVVSHQDKIYFYDKNGFKEYDPETDTWNSLPAPPLGRQTSLVSLNGKLLSVGGMVRNEKWGDGEISDSIYEFDYSTQKWVEFTKMNEPLMLASTAAGPFY